jgi:Na+/H+ antiporter NhaD/arsenite permease-like protein
VIVVERAKDRPRISFLDFLKVGAPTALVSLGVGAARLALVR